MILNSVMQKRCNDEFWVFKVTFTAIPRSALIRATFDDTDPKVAPAVGTEVDAPNGATRLRVVAEINGQFSQEESAPLQARVDGGTPPKQVLKPDSPAVMTSRFEPKDTAAAFSALERLVKTPNVNIFGGSIDVNGGRSEAYFLAESQEISVRLRMHGGPGRTRTSNQAVMGALPSLERSRIADDSHRRARANAYLIEQLLIAV